jgi:DNA polymerase elongation subunit (family B)
MAEFQEVEVKDKVVPTVVLIGREVETLRKVMYRVPVHPYFFIAKRSGEDIPAILHSFGVEEGEETKIASPWNQPLKKLYVKDPSKLRNLFSFLRKYRDSKGRLQLYGAGLATPDKLPLKYLLDSGIKSGFIVNGEVKPVEAECPLRIWLIDFECESKLINTVNPYRDEPLIMCTFYDSYTDEYVTVHTHPKDFKPLLPNHRVVRVPSEKHLLLYLQGCLDKKYDPDLIGAHNLNRYDLTKWILRLEANHLDKNSISPRPFRFVDRRSFPVKVKGRIICDMLEALKLYTLEEYDSYALEYLVDKLELNVPKVPFSAPIAELWNDRVNIDLDTYPLKEYFIKAGITKEEFRASYIVLLRNLLDVMAVKAYNDKFQLIEFFDSLRKEFGGLFEDMMIRNQMIETGVLRMINDKVALPSRLSRIRDETYKGAFVFEPKPGYYRNIAVLDFSREYPSLIQKLNISPETYIKMGVEWYGREEEFVEYHKKKGNHVVYQPKGRDSEYPKVYVFKKTPRGIIPSWVTRTFELRDMWEQREKKAIKEGDEEQARICGIRAKVAKIAANASYGWMSFSGSPLYSKDCSATTALCGYLASQKLIEFLRELGYEAVYGDTDSIFYQMKERETLEDVKRVRDLLNKKLAEWSTKEWNIAESPFHLSIKMLFSDWICLTKKRYGGKYYYHEKKGYVTGYEFKGLELIRSDSSALEKEVQKNIFKLMLDRQPEKIPEYWSQIEARLMRQEYSPIDVAYPSAIKKRLEERVVDGKKYWVPVGYRKVIPSHVRAAIASNQLLGTDFKQGDKPRRLPINTELLRGPKTIEIMTESGMVVKPLKDIAIDEYYILPEEWRRAIDWQRIRKRLSSKVDKVIESTGILRSKFNTLEAWLK